MTFRLKPKPGTLHYQYNLSANEEDGGKWQTPKRRIYFTGEVWQPAKIHLANGRILDLVGRGEGDHAPVWVTLWDSPGTPDIDGSSSFVGVVPDDNEPHLVINVHLEAAKLIEVLRNLRDGKDVTFQFSERHGYMFGEKPHILGFHQPSWRADGDSYSWRDDLKRAVAIEHIEILTKLSEALPEVSEEEDAEPEPVEDPTENRRNELSGAIGALIQSISSLENTTVAAHRLMMTRLILVIVALAVIALGVWFRH